MYSAAEALYRLREADSAVNALIDEQTILAVQGEGDESALWAADVVADYPGARVLGDAFELAFAQLAWSGICDAGLHEASGFSHELNSQLGTFTRSICGSAR